MNCDVRIVNEGTIDDFRIAIDALMTRTELKNTPGVSAKVKPSI
jgi:hypothetical protein